VVLFQRFVNESGGRELGEEFLALLKGRPASPTMLTSAFLLIVTAISDHDTAMDREVEALAVKLCALCDGYDLATILKAHMVSALQSAVVIELSQKLEGKKNGQ